MSGVLWGYMTPPPKAPEPESPKPLQSPLQNSYRAPRTAPPRGSSWMAFKEASGGFGASGLGMLGMRHPKVHRIRGRTAANLGF